jgi:hypothetical protein
MDTINYEGGQSATVYSVRGIACVRDGRCPPLVGKSQFGDPMPSDEPTSFSLVKRVV